MQRQEPHTAAAIGVDLKDIEGAALAIQPVTATGTGVLTLGTTAGGFTLTSSDASANAAFSVFSFSS